MVGTLSEATRNCWSKGLWIKHLSICPDSINLEACLTAIQWETSQALRPLDNDPILIKFFCRFIGVLILHFVDPALLLGFYSITCCTFSLAVALATVYSPCSCTNYYYYFPHSRVPANGYTIPKPLTGISFRVVYLVVKDK